MDIAISNTPAPTIGVALGGGAARGLAHIPYIEAMDEMGLYPSVISGTSIGALIGAGWAAGMTGKELRAHACEVLASFQLIAGTVLSAHRPSLIGILQNGLSFQVDAENITEAFLPGDFPEDFADLKVPFSTVAADFHTWKQVVFRDGPLKLAIAASMAIPAAFKPVMIDGHTYIDGGVINPVPLDQIGEEVDILVGVDVNGTPEEPSDDTEPGMVDLGFVATQIMTQTIVRAVMEKFPPDIYVQPSVNPFGLMEFWRVKELLEACDPDKDRFKRALALKLDDFYARAGAGQ